MNLKTTPLLLLPLLMSCGCWQTTPPPVSVPQGVKVELYEVASPSDTNIIAAVHPDTGAKVPLKAIPLIKTAEVDTVQRIPPDANNPNAPPGTTLGINLNITGTSKMRAATANAAGQEIALVVDGKIVAVAQIRSQLTDRIVVTGGSGNFEKQIEVLTNGN